MCIQRIRPAQLSSAFASRQSLAISSGVVSSALKTTLSGSLGECASAPAISLRVGGDLLQRPRPVEMLRAADEPDFGIGEIDHGRPSSFARAHARGALGVFDLDQVLHHPREIGRLRQAAEAVVQLAVERVELVVDGAGSPRSARSARACTRGHRRLRAGEVGMRAGEHGGGDRASPARRSGSSRRPASRSP